MSAYDEKIAVALARDVYKEIGRPALPIGCDIYYECPPKYQKDGYFGCAYRYIFELPGMPDHQYIYIIIAHRGTDNISGLVEDAKMNFFGEIPEQFYSGAMPFVQSVFEKIDEDYPYTMNKFGQFNGQEINIAFTGHSLGGTLTELSVVRYINYFVCDYRGEDNWNNCCRIMVNRAYVFDSPGSKELVVQQLKNKEITEKDIDDGGAQIVVYNSDVDAINTCMESSSKYFINSEIGNKYSSLTNGSRLPYEPDLLYYFSDYSIKDQHQISYIYDWILHRGPSYFFSISNWPVGFNTGYRAYRSYYADFCNGFERHNDYWEQYTTGYWNQNPQIHDKYEDKLFAFQDYYYRNVCYYYDGYSMSRELPYKFNIADMQRIASILSVESIVMQAHSSIRNSKKEEKTSRICCGISFFRTVDSLKSTASSAAATINRVVTETGEELERVISTANSAYEEGQYLFFVHADSLINGGHQRLSPPTKSQATFGMKK